MSASSAEPTQRTPLLYNNSKAAKRNLRNATLVIPSTGERVRRQFTLRSSGLFDGPSDTDANGGLPLHRHLSRGSWHTGLQHTKDSLKSSWVWLNSEIGRGVLKCSIAYVLACSGTFVPFFYDWLGVGGGKHMVATIVVYFHPGRSMGAMVEALICAIAAYLYFVFISIGSMAVAVLCETQWGLIELGYLIVLTVFVGGGFGFIGWVKNRMANPLVNVACSLASLTIITVLTKENAVQAAVFSNHKIVMVLKMLLMGTVISVAINMLVWPVSARRDLRQSMVDTTCAISELLTTITSSFLHGSDEELKCKGFQAATKRYQGAFAGLKRNLREARMEHYVLGTEDEYHCEAKIVSCMQRLSHNIGGLRSAAMTQFTLLEEVSTNAHAHGMTTPASPRMGRAFPPNLNSLTSSLRRTERVNTLSAISEASEEDNDGEEPYTDGSASSVRHHHRRATQESEMMDTIRTPAEIFSRFMRHLGPSMKSLVLTLQQILQELPFGPGPKFDITINENFILSLEDALQLYRHARADALENLYRTKDLGKQRVESLEADFEEVAASCGHYAYCLQDFAEGIHKYLEQLEELKQEITQPNRRSWNWLLNLVLPRRKEREKVYRGDETNSGETTPLLQAANILISNTQLPKLKMTKPKLLLSRTEYLNRQLYKILRWFGKEDIKFATKVGTGAALWAMFAFIPATRPFYAEWRGEWGLLSYMLVCSMTLGLSTQTGIARITGNATGAAVAILAWTTCQGHAIPLVAAGWLVSLPCFYLITAPGGNPSLGRFVLLTYNISALYAYSLSLDQGDEDDDLWEGGKNPVIWLIAMHRLVAVSMGVLWGMFITYIVFPSSARKSLSEGLSALWLRMGLIWKRDPLSSLVSEEKEKTYINLAAEFGLHTHLAKLEALKSSAKNEVELAGPFREKEWSAILEATRRMLDAFHAMNAVIAMNVVLTPGEKALLRFTTEERERLCIRICQLFQVLASSLRLEYNMAGDGGMPSVVTPRDQLLSRIFTFRRADTVGGVEVHGDNADEVIIAHRDSENVGPGDVAERRRSLQSLIEEAKASENAVVAFGEGEEGVGHDLSKPEREAVAKDEDYALLYAYALVTAQLAEEVANVEKEFQKLFGTVDEERMLLL